ncbi:hypothetical protein EYF80_042522 [Liparis tanakae]|uniref:Uncharacterized protein n=1 Tax=Liparis tanakae TaxID=230148 RepID=A0A4Z2G123_9TELE|nr:hypothetical protein EYF80_042522 [Liparis tanakae]
MCSNKQAVCIPLHGGGGGGGQIEENPPRIQSHAHLAARSRRVGLQAHRRGTAGLQQGGQIDPFNEDFNVGDDPLLRRFILGTREQDVPRRPLAVDFRRGRSRGGGPVAAESSEKQAQIDGTCRVAADIACNTLFHRKNTPSGLWRERRRLHSAVPQHRLAFSFFMVTRSRDLSECPVGEMKYRQMWILVSW